MPRPDTYHCFQTDPWGGRGGEGRGGREGRGEGRGGEGGEGRGGEGGEEGGGRKERKARVSNRQQITEGRGRRKEGERKEKDEL